MVAATSSVEAPHGGPDQGPGIGRYGNASFGLRFINEISRSRAHRVSVEELLLRRRYADAMSELNDQIHESIGDYRIDDRVAA